MASTGDVLPTSGTTVDRAGATAWTSPENITADDGTYTQAAVPTDYLVATGFGFNLPAGATILGVTVKVQAYETGSGASNFVPQLCSAATPTLIGSAKTATTVSGGSAASPNDYTIGGTADLWGATLTPAVVNDAGFGVVCWSTDTTNTLFIDFVTIAIEYLDPVGGTSVSTFQIGGTAAGTVAGQQIIDDGDGWWAGAQNCFVGVAMAGAAAALGLAVAVGGALANQNEEIVPQPEPTQAGTPTYRAPIRLHLWQQTDELPMLEVGATSASTFTASGAAAAGVEVAGTSAAASDIGGTATATVGTPPVPVVDDYHWRPPDLRDEITCVVWATTDELGAPTPLPVDETEWQAPPDRAEQPTCVLWATDEEIVPQATPLPVDIDSPPLFGPAQPNANYVVWATDEEIVPQPASGAIGGSILRESVRIVRWYQSDEITQPAGGISAATFTIGGTAAGTVSRALGDDSFWNLPVVETDWLVFLWVVDDEFAPQIHGTSAASFAIGGSASGVIGGTPIVGTSSAAFATLGGAASGVVGASPAVGTSASTFALVTTSVAQVLAQGTSQTAFDIGAVSTATQGAVQGTSTASFAIGGASSAVGGATPVVGTSTASFAIGATSAAQAPAQATSSAAFALGATSGAAVEIRGTSATAFVLGAVSSAQQPPRTGTSAATFDVSGAGLGAVDVLATSASVLSLDAVSVGQILVGAASSATFALGAQSSAVAGANPRVATSVASFTIGSQTTAGVVWSPDDITHDGPGRIGRDRSARGKVGIY